jgi:D-glycero-D-manno-heptose 1,7-bisphosphate phosphatase
VTVDRVPILFLDLDGTVRHGFDELGRFVNGPDDVVVFPEAVQRMHEWRDLGGRIVGCSNQGGIALGHVTEADVQAAVKVTRAATDQLFEGIGWCPHHPDVWACWCRKPRPGLALSGILRLQERYPGEIYPADMAMFVGDRPEDRDCAAALGIRFQWASAWRAGDRP